MTGLGARTKPYHETQTCLTIEADTVLDGGVGGERGRRKRQGKGLQGGTHNAHQERPRLRPSKVIWKKEKREGWGETREGSKEMTGRKNHRGKDG